MNYCLFALISISICLPIPAKNAPLPNTAKDLSIKDSPVFQRWQRQVPNILEDIKNDPSFRTRLRLGYNRFSTENGVNVGVEDVFIGQSKLTVSGEYQQAFRQENLSYGGDLHYYLRPLGSCVNIAPLVGYRHLQTKDYATNRPLAKIRFKIDLHLS